MLPRPPHRSLWRCGIPQLRIRWPWDNEKAAAKFSAWEQRYLDTAKDYAVCKFLGHFGLPEIHPALRELVEYHDRATQSDSAKPLWLDRLYGMA